ncbi:MAG: hypothetical protein ACFB2X_25110 [Rivularia sp. (in: cyanobacteria)]
MSNPLSILIVIVGSLFAGFLINLSNKKNKNWSKKYFLPLMFWLLFGTFVAMAIQEAIVSILGVDSETFPDLIGLGLMISGYGIHWYRTSTPK